MAKVLAMFCLVFVCAFEFGYFGVFLSSNIVCA